MSQYVTVVCDGGDCYESIHDCESSDAHETDSYGSDRPGFVTAFKRIPWSEAYPNSSSDLDWLVDRWQVWCRSCATLIDLQKLRDDGWEVKVPEGYVEGKVCPDCFHGTVCPGRRDNGLPPWTGSGATFAMNPDFKQWPCETCDGDGHLVKPVEDTRPRSER